MEDTHMTNLDILANSFITNLIRLKEKLSGKVLVFDMDGTMSAFQYAEDSLLPCRDDDVYEYSKYHNIYENARALKYFQYLIEDQDPTRVFVLTRTETTLIEKKNDFIHKNFHFIESGSGKIIPFLDKNIIHVQIADKKLDVLNELHEKFGEDIHFVEDTFKTILNAEEKYSFVIGHHVSDVLV